MEIHTSNTCPAGQKIVIINEQSFSDLLAGEGMSQERETLELDVLFVGAGPANLAGALHLKNLIKAHNEAVVSGKKQGRKLDELAIGVIEKGREVGAHILSGGVMDPRAL